MRNQSEDQMTLVFIRHGETKANRERRYLGRTEEPLSGEGKMALESYQKQGYYPRAAYLFSSPKKRCLETAQILYPQLTPVLIAEWEEIDFGRFEYKNYEELKADAQYQAWIDSGGVLPFPGGESREEFMIRCERGFVKMCREICLTAERSGEEAVTVGIVVHGGTIMALLSRHGGGNYFDWQVINGGGYVCRMKGQGGSARFTGIRKLGEMSG